MQTISGGCCWSGNVGSHDDGHDTVHDTAPQQSHTDHYQHVQTTTNKEHSFRSEYPTLSYKYI